MKRILAIVLVSGLFAESSFAARVGVVRREGEGSRTEENNDNTPRPNTPQRSFGHDGVRGGNDSNFMRPRTVIKMRRHDIPQPARIRNSKQIIRDRTMITAPDRDEHGSVISQPAAASAPSNHVSVVRNNAVVRDITRVQRSDNVPNRYYWHTAGGIRYAHYYDRRNHWYGFYHGDNFYWTRYYYNRWWWYDPGYSRWVYYGDGYWWWPGPQNRLYVYVDNSYYPYDEGRVTVQKPEVDTPPAEEPETSSEGQSWDSPDGKRMVQVIGEKRLGFLYDKTPGKPVFMTYMGTGIEKVRYSGGTDKQPLKILIDFKDGSFALFNQDGNPLDEDDNSVIPPNSPVPSAPPPASPPPIPEQ